jgi:hypothetical protein
MDIDREKLKDLVEKNGMSWGNCTNDDDGFGGEGLEKSSESMPEKFSGDLGEEGRQYLYSKPSS